MASHEEKQLKRPSVVLPIIVGIILLVGQSFIIYVSLRYIATFGVDWQYALLLVIPAVTIILSLLLGYIGLSSSKPLFGQNESLFSEMQETQQELISSRRLYQTIVEDQNEMIVRFAPNGAINFMNKAFASYFNKSPEEISQQDIWSLIPKPDHERFQRYFVSLTEDSPTRSIIYRVKVNNNIIWQQWRLRAFYEHNQLIEYQGVGQDITEQKNAEDTVLKTTARLQFLLSASPAVIYTSHPSDDFNILFISRNVEQLFGHPQLNFWTVDGFWSQNIHPDDREIVIKSRSDLAMDKRTGIDYRVRNQEGLYRWVHDEFRRTINESGEEVIIGAWIDISASKVVEAELREARDEAETANNAKSSFLATMSHELRTPLNAILGFSQLILAEEDLPQQTRQHMTTISQSGEHLLNLINDVLEVSRIEAGRVTLNLSTFSVRKAMRDIEDMMGIRADEKDLDLVFEGTEFLPGRIEADESKFRQVMINLVSNAIKFTKSGMVSVHVSYERLTNEILLGSKFQGRLDVTVKDTGQGIASDELDSLFKPFAQTRTGKRLQEGTGLGLAITREFVRLMGGDINVISDVEEGSIFKFHITINEIVGTITDSLTDDWETDTRTRIRLAEDSQAYRILVVEDDKNSRELMLHTLQNAGFVVEVAINGSEALTVVADWNPHLIFMDMHMPVMNGLNATKLIRVENEDIKIIALSADVFDKENFMTAGCDDFITKPFNRPLLFLKLQEHLNLIFESDRRKRTDREHKIRRQKLNTDRLSSVPPMLLEALEQAATSLDVQAAHQVTDNIRPIAPDIADKLHEMITNFRFDLIQKLIEEMKNDTSVQSSDTP